MTTVAIVQARLGSLRLPRKVLRPVTGEPMIGLMLRRLRRSSRLDRVVLATSDDSINDPLATYANSLGVHVFRGDEHDVLDRFYHAALAVDASVIVRLTGDCPLVDPAVVDELIKLYFDSGVDYASNVSPRSFPIGLDAEVFSMAALTRAQETATSQDQREHVTVLLRESGQFSTANLCWPDNHSTERWTVDEPEDLVVIENVFQHFYPQIDFSWLEVLALRQSKPTLFDANLAVSHEGRTLLPSQKLERRVRRAEISGPRYDLAPTFARLGNRWPRFFDRAIGVTLTDIDGVSYWDYSCMGYGHCLVGYGDPDILATAAAAVDSGTGEQRWSYESVELTERLIDWIPGSEHVRLFGSLNVAKQCILETLRRYVPGGVTQIADTTIGLAKGLAGPDDMVLDVAQFLSLSADELGQRFGTGRGGALWVDATSLLGQPVEVLRRANDLAERYATKWVVDESLTMFKEHRTGVHGRLGFCPDLTLIGESLGNGGTIAALVGAGELAERAVAAVGFEAPARADAARGLATLRRIEAAVVSDEWCALAKRFVDSWRAVASRYDVAVTVTGPKCLPRLRMIDRNAQVCESIVEHEMLAQHRLATVSFCASLAHDSGPDEIYLDCLDKAFKKIANEVTVAALSHNEH